MNHSRHAPNWRTLETATATPDSVARLGDLALGRWAAASLSGLKVLQICDSSGPSRDVVESASSLTCVVAHRAIVDVVTNDFGDTVNVHSAEPDRLPFASDSFGGLLCPADAAGAETVLTELIRVLRQRDGVLILTPTPLGSPHAGPTGGTPLVDAVRKEFEHVAILEQHDCFLSFFDATRPEEAASSEPGITVELEPSRVAARRSVLVASNMPLSYLSFPIAVAAPMDLAQWRAARADQLAASAKTRSQAAGSDAAAERGYLLQQLFLSEQTLALALDAANRREMAAVQARERLAETQRRLDETYTELERMRNELPGINAKIAAIEAEVDREHQLGTAAHLQVVALRSSTSWRVTKPLRLLRRLTGSNDT